MQTSHSLCWDKAVTQMFNSHFPDLTGSVIIVTICDIALYTIFVFNAVPVIMTKTVERNDDTAST